MKNLKIFYYRVLNLGVDKKSTSERNLKIKILNAFAAISVLIMVIATILVITLSLKDAYGTGTANADSILALLLNRKYFTFILFDTLSIIICFVVLLLNYKRKYTSAVLVMSIFVNILVVHYYWLRGGADSILFFHRHPDSHCLF